MAKRRVKSQPSAGLAATVLRGLVRGIPTACRTLIHPMCGHGRQVWQGVGVVGLVIAFILLEPAISRRVERPVDSVRIAMLSVPAWADQSILEHIASLAATELNGTTLSRADLSQAHQALVDSGFFTSVSQVSRTGPKHVIIEASLVTPLALVRDRHGSAMIDSGGRLMPAGCRVSSEAHLVNIVNPRYSRPTRPGAVWSGGDLGAAIGVLSQISSAVWIHQVDAIDLSRYTASGSLVLITDNGSRIVWGSAPGSEQAMESLLDRKIARLNELHRLSGRIDQYHRGELDITDASVVVKR